MDLERTTQTMTLVEKLRNKRNEWASNPHYWMDSNLIGDVFSDVIRTVEAHSDWVRCDERLPPLEQPVLVYNHGNLRVLSLCKTDSGLKWLDEFGQDEFDLDEIDFWQLLPQPPREPQYLISKGGYWYRPNAKGYEAGRFSKEFAERHAKEVPEVRIFEDKEKG